MRKRVLYEIGYARISTEGQLLTLQLDALKQAGCAKFFQEKVSGAYRDRPELNRMLDQLRKGDIVIVWKLDRLARSTRNLLDIVETISNTGARFQPISEPWADTTTHAGKMIMTIFAGIAESSAGAPGPAGPTPISAESALDGQRR